MAKLVDHLGRALFIVALTSISLTARAADTPLIGGNSFDDGHSPDICELLATNQAPQGFLSLSLFQDIAHFAPSTTLFDYRAVDGISALLNEEWGFQLLLDLLIRTEVVTEDGEDVNYIPLLLLRRNPSLIYPTEDKLDEDPLLDRYLRKKLGRLAGADRSVQVDAAEQRKRKNLFMSYFFRAWEDYFKNQIYRHSDESSRTIHLAFYQVNEWALLRRSGLITAETFQELSSSIVASIETYGLYRPRLRGLPQVIRMGLALLPVVGNITLDLEDIARRVYERQVMGSDVEIKGFVRREAQMHWELLPFSTVIYLRNPPHLAKHREKIAALVTAWQEPSVDPLKDLDSFQRQVLAAFPEHYLVEKKSTPSLYAAPADKNPPLSDLGEVSPEYHKAIKRLAISVAILRNDQSAFPGLTAGEFTELRKFVRSTLSLQAGSQDVPQDELIAFAVFLTLDTLGRADTPFTEFLEGESKAKEQAGRPRSNYRQRMMSLLKMDPFLSPSLLSLDQKQMKFIMGCVETMYFFNAGELLNMEGGFDDLSVLGAKSESELDWILLRSLLSYISLGIGDGYANATFNGESLQAWLRLRDILRKNLKNPDYGARVLADLNELHLKRWENALQRHEISLSSPKALTFVSLAKQSGIREEAGFDDLVKAFDELERDSLREVLIESEAHTNVLTFNSALLFEEFRTRRGDASTALRAWLGVLSRSLESLLRSEKFKNARHRIDNVKPDEFRLNLGPLLQNVDQAERGRLKIRFLGVEGSAEVHSVP